MHNHHLCAMVLGKLAALQDCRKMGADKKCCAGRNISNEETGSRDGSRGRKVARNASIFGSTGQRLARGQGRYRCAQYFRRQCGLWRITRGNPGTLSKLWIHKQGHNPAGQVHWTSKRVRSRLHDPKSTPSQRCQREDYLINPQLCLRRVHGA